MDVSAPKPLSFTGFRNLWLGQTTSQLGDAIYALVFVFMANKVTGRADVVGVVAALTALPFLVFGPYAGVVADRRDRQRLMLAADLASAGLLFAFAVYVWLQPRPSVVVIGAAGFLLSTVNVFFLPARSAAIPRLVPPEALQAALAFSNATMSLIQSAGIAFGAIVLGPIERANPGIFFVSAVLLNAVTFLVSAFFVAKVPAVPPAERDTDSSARQDVAEGVRLILREPLLRITLPVSLLINLAISGFFVVYVRTNDVWFGGSFATISWLEFGFVFSMLLGSILAGRLNVRRPGVAFTLAMAGVGLCVAAMGFATNFWAYLALNVVCGIALPFGTLPLMTYIGTAIPDEYRGRVSSVSSMLAAGVQPVGMAVSGVLLQSLGLVRLYMVMGGGMTLAALLGLGDRGYRAARVPQASNERSEE